MSVYTINNLHQWAEKVQMNIEKAVRVAAIDLAGKIIKATPVDTGTAKGNWNIAINNPDLSTDKPPDKNRSLRPGDVPKVRLDQKIIISNNLPYIGKLEHGSSKQAPAGMVAVSISGWQETVAQVAEEVRENRRRLAE